MSLFQYQCLCKPNVVGRTCDRCMHGFYNFSGSNPLGCTSCSCSPRGTVSGTRNCHVQNGRCDCKNHVIGKKCQNCRDGYHGMKSQDIFGCKGNALIYLCFLLFPSVEAYFLGWRVKTPIQTTVCLKIHRFCFWMLAFWVISPLMASIAETVVFFCSVSQRVSVILVVQLAETVLNI